MSFKLSIATREHIPAIEPLIAESVRCLGRPFYTMEQIEAALRSAWGVDTQLISDGTFFVIHLGKELAACGGWSFRETLFGNDSADHRNDLIIDPVCGFAKIRAFFVRPEFARKGLGSMLMRKCESEAKRMGYGKLELMATLPGQKLYEKHGFTAGMPIDYALSESLSIQFVPMRKESI